MHWYWCIEKLHSYSTSNWYFMCASPPPKAYLSEDDFKKVFEISVQEFRALPKWKQGNLKKKVDLF